MQIFEVCKLSNSALVELCWVALAVSRRSFAHVFDRGLSLFRKELQTDSGFKLLVLGVKIFCWLSTTAFSIKTSLHGTQPLITHRLQISFLAKFHRVCVLKLARLPSSLFIAALCSRFAVIYMHWNASTYTLFFSSFLRTEPLCYYRSFINLHWNMINSIITLDFPASFQNSCALQFYLQLSITSVH